MFMSLQLQNSPQRKQAGSWKTHECSVSGACFVLMICCVAKSSGLDCFITEPNMLNVVDVPFFSELESTKKVRINNQLRWSVVIGNHQLFIHVHI